jgi:hypothetical protein
MRIQIITKHNGLGLSHDVEVLRSALVGIAGHEMHVDFTDWQDRSKGTPKGHYDHNIFLELLNPAFYPEARSNIMVPNPEWFMREWLPHVKGLTTVWAKTGDCMRIFKGLHGHVVRMGWTSKDRHSPSVQRRKALLHVAGGSSAKGTAEVLAAMRMLPEYRLTMIARKPWGEIPANVDLMDTVTEAELTELMNAHAIHLCPSSYEGFGHYINEARSVGAVVITTAAEPMTDLVDASTGFGATAARITTQNLAQHKHVDVVSLAACIEMAMNASPETLATIGERARRAYHADDLSFTNNLIKALR